MYKKILQAITVVIFMAALSIPAVMSQEKETVVVAEHEVIIETIPETPLRDINPVKLNPTATPVVEEETPSLSDEEIDLIALVTMAEAEGECPEGQRLVIDTILNRVDSEHFPDTVTEVIYQKNQFSSMWNGRVDRCYVRDDIRLLVLEELESRYNSEVIFFRSGGRYSDYGVPMFQVGGHWFSSWD